MPSKKGRAPNFTLKVALASRIEGNKVLDITREAYKQLTDESANVEAITSAPRQRRSLPDQG